LLSYRAKPVSTIPDIRVRTCNSAPLREEGPEGRVEGWEKRAGVMRVNGPGTRKLTKQNQ